MSLRIITFTLIMMLFLSPTVQLVNAQDNETEPLLGGTNSTIPVLLDGNTTLTNTTIIDTNSTSLNETELMVDPLALGLLASIREQAQSRTQEMLQLLGDSTLPPEIANGMLHAQQAMEQAQSFEDSNARAAAQQYLRAMKQYRNTLRKYLNDNPDVLTEFEASVPDVNGTASDDINATVTAEVITSAKNQLINRFQERFQEQVAAMMENVDNISEDMSPQDAFKAQQALTKTEQKLLRIQERILNGEYDEALNDLDNATETLDKDFGDMEDHGTAQMLKTMNQLEAKIQKMEQNSARKAAKGESTAEEDALLAELRGNKNNAKNDFKENNGKGNSDDKITGKPDDTGNPDTDKSNNGKGEK